MHSNAASQHFQNGGCPFSKESLSVAIGVFQNEAEALTLSDITSESLIACAVKAAVAPGLPIEQAQMLKRIPPAQLLDLLAKPVLYKLTAPHLQVIVENTFACIENAKKSNPNCKGLGFFDGSRSVTPFIPKGQLVNDWLATGELPYSREDRGIDPTYFVPLAAPDLTTITKGDVPLHYLKTYVLGFYWYAAHDIIAQNPKDERISSLLASADAVKESPPERARILWPNTGLNDLDAVHMFLRTNVLNLAKVASHVHARLMEKYEPRQFKLQSELLKCLPNRNANVLGDFYGSGFEAATLRPLELLRVGIYRLITDIHSGRAAKYGEDFNAETIKGLLPSLKNSLLSIAHGSFEDFAGIEIGLGVKHTFGFRLDHKYFMLSPIATDGHYDLQLSGELGFYNLMPDESQQITQGCPGLPWIGQLAKNMWDVSLHFMLPNLEKYIPQLEAEIFSQAK